MNRNGIRIGIVAALLVSMFAMASVPVSAYQELTATWQNTNSLTALTYSTVSPYAWAAYYDTAGKYKGYLLKWDYNTYLDANYKRSLSVTTYSGNTIKGVNVADRNGNYYGQCVSFVKSLAKSTIQTSSWTKGRNAFQSVQSNPVARGVAIAKFNSNGRYDCCGASHVAYFDRYYYVNGILKGIVVWDQNYVRNCGGGDCGLVGYHVILKTDTGSTSDAAAYNVVLTDGTIVT